jgi:DNA-binding response OmpR family regulator
MNGWQVLIIDDDPQILKIVRVYLEEENHKVYTAESGSEALEILDKHSVDVVLLDMVLPDYSGLTLLGEIKKKTGAPVMVVSGKGETADRIVGLEMGADDYITKPFHLRELSARIKSVLRRAGNHSNGDISNGNGQEAREIIEFDGWRMDCSKYELYDPEGQSVPVTTGEFRLLKVLTESANRALSRDRLFDITRGEDYDTFDRAVDIQINRLRRKLGDDPSEPKLIKTVRGVGYMFIANVKKSGRQ